MDLLHRKAQSYKFSNKNDLFCAWRDFNKIFCGISTYHKWMLKLQISSIFNFDWAHQSWISAVLGVKLNSNLLWLEFFLMAKLIGNSFAQKLGDNLYAINFEWVYLLHLMWIWQPLLNNFDFDWSAHDSTGWLKNQHRLSCRR